MQGPIGLLRSQNPMCVFVVEVFGMSGMTVGVF